jgi:hypothetical protein
VGGVFKRPCFPPFFSKPLFSSCYEIRNAQESISLRPGAVISTAAPARGERRRKEVGRGAVAGYVAYVAFARPNGSTSIPTQACESSIFVVRSAVLLQ